MVYEHDGCEGCKWANIIDCEHCVSCSGNAIDKYEPKDSNDVLKHLKKRINRLWEAIEDNKDMTKREKKAAVATIRIILLMIDSDVLWEE